MWVEFLGLREHNVLEAVEFGSLDLHVELVDAWVLLHDSCADLPHNWCADERSHRQRGAHWVVLLRVLLVFNARSPCR